MPAITMENTPTKLQKIKMQAWLKNHGILYSENDLKMNIMAEITPAHSTAVYLTHVEAEVQGHEVVRLPVAHCELNLIEPA